MEIESVHQYELHVTFLPVNSTINELLLDSDVVETSLNLRKAGNCTNGLSEQTVGDRKNIGLVNNGDLLITRNM